MHVIIDYIKENDKKIFIAIVVIIILSVISIFVNSKNSDKVYSSESYVYTKETYNHNNGLSSELPYINIKGEKISEINTSLINKYYEIITVNDRVMKYKSYKNKNIISLIVKINDIESSDSYPIEVIIYNVNIENGDIISDDELLDIYNISKYEVADVIKNKINEYYLYEIRKNYVNNDCDFDCYLDFTNSLPFDNCKYYVKDNRLIAYKNIRVGYEFFYDVSSGFDLFNFEISGK